MREIILYTDFIPSSISFSFKALFEALKSHLYQMHRASFGESQAAKEGWDWWTFFLNKKLKLRWPNHQGQPYSENFIYNWGILPMRS